MDFDKLSEADLAPVYFVISAEPLLVDRAATRIRDLAVPEAARGFNYDVIDGRGVSGERILNAAQTVPMMAARRMVWVRDVAAVSAAELAKLASYLETPSPSTVLLATAAKVDKRIKLFQLAKKRGFMHELSPPRNPTPWVRDEAKRRGLRIAPAAAARLGEVVGADLARLSLSLEQLALYSGDSPIEVDAVDDLIAETRERTVFELTDAIGEGNRTRALAALHNLFDQRQSAIGVVIMLARHMRQLALAQAGQRRRMGKGELTKLVGAPPFVVDKLVAQSRRYPPGALDRALTRLAEVDFGLKGGAPMVKTLGRELGDQVLLDRLVTELIALGGR